MRRRRARGSGGLFAGCSRRKQRDDLRGPVRVAFRVVQKPEFVPCFSQEGELAKIVVIIDVHGVHAVFDEIEQRFDGLY